jgi:DNA-binding Xre family transcriptional regulator
MGVTYQKLRDLMRDNKILNKTLKEKAGVTGDELAKIKWDEKYMTLESLDKIHVFFSELLGREITPNELFDFKK